MFFKWQSFISYISIRFLFSSLCFLILAKKWLNYLSHVINYSLLTWKVDKLNKCILFELSLYGFTQVLNILIFIIGLLQLFVFIFQLCLNAFSCVILHHMIFVSIFTTSSLFNSSLLFCCLCGKIFRDFVGLSKILWLSK